MKGYYFITDSSLSINGNRRDVIEANRAKVCIVQYRNKQGNSRELYEEALELRQICRASLFVVNDRVDIAIAVKADGVHLGQEDLPFSAAKKLLGTEKIIGLTVHSLEEALEAARLGASYLGVSPIFSTSTKPDAGPPSGLKLLSEIRKQVDLPLVAIGGINLSNAPEVINAGADGLCAISAVITQEDVCSEIMKFHTLFVQENEKKL